MPYSFFGCNGVIYGARDGIVFHQSYAHNPNEVDYMKKVVIDGTINFDRMSREKSGVVVRRFDNLVTSMNRNEELEEKLADIAWQKRIKSIKNLYDALAA